MPSTDIVQLDPSVRPTISVDETAIVLGVARTTAYEAIRQGHIPVIKVGGRLRVPVAALRRMLALDGTLADADPLA
jgi:excisionase family DNA binding protein